MLCRDAKCFPGETGSRLELFGQLQHIEATQAPDSGRRGQPSVSNAVRVVEVLPARILLSDRLKGFTGLCAIAQIVPSSFESAGTPVIFSTCGRECVVQPWESPLMQKPPSQAAALRVEGRRTAFRAG